METKKFLIDRYGNWDDLTDECKVSTFLIKLDQKIHEAKDMLIERYNYIINQNPASAKFMYENNIMLGYDGKNIESAMKHGTLAVGQLGLAETLRILIGKDQTTEEGMQLAKRIEQLFKDRCAEFKKEYKLNFRRILHTSRKFMLYSNEEIPKEIWQN